MVAWHKKLAKRWVERIGRHLDLEIQPKWHQRRGGDIPDWQWEIAQSARDYTMTSLARVLALVRAVEHIHLNGIEGDVVECGVWRGGSMMSVARALCHLRCTRRHLHLFDTFAGMSEPTNEDGGATHARWQAQQSDQHNTWCFASLDDVTANMEQTGYPQDRVHFVPGPVEHTLPDAAPKDIALLRLDTDWYASTKHELEHLYPRLQPGGILIIDDYGHWPGCQQAVDEFLALQDIPIFLAPVDYTGRIAVKPCVTAVAPDPRTPATSQT